MSGDWVYWLLAVAGLSLIMNLAFAKHGSEMSKENKALKAEAVTRGHAELYIDEKSNEPEWRWKKKEPENAGR